MLIMSPEDPNHFSSDVDHHHVEKRLSGGESYFSNSTVRSIAWQNLTVTVNDRTTGHDRDILHRASGVVKPGEMLALMGPSGSGKTTLLNTLARRTDANAGHVLINGKQYPLCTHRAISSFVEQEDTLIGSLTVDETLKFAAKLALPASVSRAEIRDRVSKLVGSFGLGDQRRTLIGSPLRKGISGGQKRRVSVATQLITGPSVLYLDEPTSGLDSTASYEVMSFISRIALANNLIVIASIHQPSTKTLDLFSKVMLLSKGRPCYFGYTSDVDDYFNEIGMPIPPLTNPAEHMLDITNADFGNDADGARLDAIFTRWKQSQRAQLLDTQLAELFGDDVETPFVPHAAFTSQVVTLLHRAFIKSYRDLVAYWIRLVMYMGLSIMMGTVWLRLTPHQDHIQPFINAIFFGSAFMSFMAVAYVPAFLEDRSMFVKERANGLYGPTAFVISNFLIALPYLFLISILFSIFSYWMINLRPTGGAFFVWVMWLFLDLVAAESLVVLISSLFPNFVVALAFIAFANGLWMSVGGFLVSLPVLNVFWKYVFHYIDYQAYVFQGMMVNEFGSRNYNCEVDNGNCFCMYQSALQSECKIEGIAVLDKFGYPTGRQGKWVGIMIGIIVVYRLFGWAVTWYRKT